MCSFLIQELFANSTNWGDDGLCFKSNYLKEIAPGPSC